MQGGSQQKANMHLVFTIVYVLVNLFIMILSLMSWLQGSLRLGQSPFHISVWVMNICVGSYVGVYLQEWDHLTWLIYTIQHLMLVITLFDSKNVGRNTNAKTEASDKRRLPLQLLYLLMACISESMLLGGYQTNQYAVQATRTLYTIMFLDQIWHLRLKLREWFQIDQIRFIECLSMLLVSRLFIKINSLLLNVVDLGKQSTDYDNLWIDLSLAYQFVTIALAFLVEFVSNRIEISKQKKAAQAKIKSDNQKRAEHIKKLTAQRERHLRQLQVRQAQIQSLKEKVDNYAKSVPQTEQSKATVE